MELMSEIHNPAGLGYCIPEDLQAHAQPCTVMSSADQCGGHALCFVGDAPASTDDTR